jgi:hypothetical protein
MSLFLKNIFNTVSGGLKTRFFFKLLLLPEVRRPDPAGFWPRRVCFRPTSGRVLAGFWPGAGQLTAHHRPLIGPALAGRRLGKIGHPVN